MRVDDELLTLAPLSSVLVGPVGPATVQRHRRRCAVARGGGAGRGREYARNDAGVLAELYPDGRSLAAGAVGAMNSRCAGISGAGVFCKGTGPRRHEACDERTDADGSARVRPRSRSCRGAPGRALRARAVAARTPRRRRSRGRRRGRSRPPWASRCCRSSARRRPSASPSTTTAAPPTSTRPPGSRAPRSGRRGRGADGAGLSVGDPVHDDHHRESGVHVRPGRSEGVGGVRARADLDVSQRRAADHRWTRLPVDLVPAWPSTPRAT